MTLLPRRHHLPALFWRRLPSPANMPPRLLLRRAASTPVLLSAKELAPVSTPCPARAGLVREPHAAEVRTGPGRAAGRQAALRRVRRN
jgi:hypothetical protein